MPIPLTDVSAKASIRSSACTFKQTRPWLLPDSSRGQNTYRFPGELIARGISQTWCGMLNVHSSGHMHLSSLHICVLEHVFSSHKAAYAQRRNLISVPDANRIWGGVLSTSPAIGHLTIRSIISARRGTSG